MSAPDIELIAETELISEGYKNAKKLAGKIVSLFRLMKQLLSNQKHYDWGLRALKTILKSSGQLVQ
jgi:dynein heavy chain 2